MYEESDSTAPKDSSRSAKGMGRWLTHFVIARRVARLLLTFLVVIILGFIAAMEFMAWIDYFEPRTDVVLGTERWKPFLQSTTRISDATQNIDDGSIVFLMHPEFDDRNTYFETVSEDARVAGWVNLSDEEGGLSELGYAVKGRATALLKKRAGSTNPVRNVFLCTFPPSYPGGRGIEFLEITFLEKPGAVLFVSYYGDT